MDALPDPHGPKLSHRVDCLTFDCAVREPTSPLYDGAALATALRRELLPTIEAMLLELFGDHPEAAPNVAINEIDIDLGAFPAEPDWTVVRAELAQRLRMELTPFSATAEDAPFASSTLTEATGEDASVALSTADGAAEDGENMLRSRLAQRGESDADAVRGSASASVSPDHETRLSAAKGQDGLDVANADRDTTAIPAASREAILSALAQAIATDDRADFVEALVEKLLAIDDGSNRNGLAPLDAPGVDHTAALSPDASSTIPAPADLPASSVTQPSGSGSDIVPEPGAGPTSVHKADLKAASSAASLAATTAQANTGRASASAAAGDDRNASTSASEPHSGNIDEPDAQAAMQATESARGTRQGAGASADAARPADSAETPPRRQTPMRPHDAHSTAPTIDPAEDAPSAETPQDRSAELSARPPPTDGTTNDLPEDDAAGEASAGQGSHQDADRPVEQGQAGERRATVIATEDLHPDEADLAGAGDSDDAVESPAPAYSASSQDRSSRLSPDHSERTLPIQFAASDAVDAEDPVGGKQAKASAQSDPTTANGPENGPESLASKTDARQATPSDAPETGESRDVPSPPPARDTDNLAGAAARSDEAHGGQAQSDQTSLDGAAVQGLRPSEVETTEVSTPNDQEFGASADDSLATSTPSNNADRGQNNATGDAETPQTDHEPGGREPGDHKPGDRKPVAPDPPRRAAGGPNGAARSEAPAEDRQAHTTTDDPDLQQGDAEHATSQHADETSQASKPEIGQPHPDADPPTLQHEVAAPSPRHDHADATNGPTGADRRDRTAPASRDEDTPRDRIAPTPLSPAELLLASWRSDADLALGTMAGLNAAALERLLIAVLTPNGGDPPELVAAARAKAADLDAGFDNADNFYRSLLFAVAKDAPIDLDALATSASNSAAMADQRPTTTADIGTSSGTNTDTYGSAIADQADIETNQVGNSESVSDSGPTRVDMDRLLDAQETTAVSMAELRTAVARRPDIAAASLRPESTRSARVARLIESTDYAVWRALAEHLIPSFDARERVALNLIWRASPTPTPVSASGAGRPDEAAAFWRLALELAARSARGSGLDGFLERAVDTLARAAGSPRNQFAAALLTHIDGTRPPGATAAMAVVVRTIRRLAGQSGSNGATGPTGTNAVQGEAMLSQTSGLVIVTRHLPMLFQRLDLTVDGQFRDADAMHMALDAMHLIAFGNAPVKPYPRRLERVLCGIRADFPERPFVSAEDGQVELIESLLRSIIEQWSALGHTSPDGLRESFLRRDGVLRDTEADWRLAVDGKAYDMLLDRLPWPLSPIRLPWMERPLYVEWRP